MRLQCVGVNNHRISRGMITVSHSMKSNALSGRSLLVYRHGQTIESHTPLLIRRCGHQSFNVIDVCDTNCGREFCYDSLHSGFCNTMMMCALS